MVSKNKILIIQLRQLGDILLTTPCIRAIKTKYPSSDLYFLSHTMGRFILEGNPYLKGTFYYDPKWSISQFIKMILALRKEKFDIILDYMHNPRSAFLSLASSHSKTIRGTLSGRRNIFYNYISEENGDGKYLVKNKLALLQMMDIATGDERLIFPWERTHLKPYLTLQKQMESFGEQSPIVVISPTHRRLERLWAKDHYLKLATYLYKSWNAKILWIWGPGEQEYVESFPKNLSFQSFLSPKCSLKELAAILANCNLFVGNSNGPSHIAVSQNVPSFQIHGPTSLKSWCPNNFLHRGIEPTRENRNSSEFSKDLINSIAVGDVIVEIEKMRELVDTTRKVNNIIKTSWKEV